MAVLIPAQGGGSAISNGQIINGVANFWQNTKPTTRVEGAALVAGDRWYKTDDGTEWFWNGTYWLSPDYVTSPMISTTGAFNLTSGSSTQLATFPIKKGQTFLKGIRLESFTTVAPVDSSNYFSTVFYFARNDALRVSNSMIASYDINTASVSATLNTNLVIPDAPNPPMVGIRCETTSVGSVGAVRFLYFPIFNYIYL